MSELIDVAKQIQKKQLELLSIALNQVLDNYRNQYETNPQIVLTGSGVKAIGIPLLRKNGIYEQILITDILNQEIVNSLTAYATIAIFVEKIKDIGK